ncbi:hypothetical protein SK128_007710 [Halocaridina rubra]|uniref:Uncharacterized protein n=1 Tax=Halocaridina rubra TaxID=373956 RepID=A0AAN8WXR4_HALRR
MEPASSQCVYYYTKQQTKYFRIRVCLQQLTGTQLVDVSPRAVEGPSKGGPGEISLSGFGIPLTTFSKASTSAANKQQQVISWQQKILSASEIIEYSRQVYADNPKYKDWHEQAVKQKKRKNWRKRIFTYIHEDDYQSRVREPPTTSELAEPQSILRKRYTSLASSDDNNHIDGNEGRNRDSKSDAKEEAKHTSELKYFFIMTDLAPSDSLGETRSYEVVLCALRLNSNGMLTVAPDFSKCNTKPYRLESFGSDNALYEYTLANVSFVRSAEEKKKDDQIIQQIASQRVEEIQQKVGSNWDEEALKPGDIRLIVNGEITKALYFNDAENLYVHFLLHLPSGKDV